MPLLSLLASLVCPPPPSLLLGRAPGGVRRQSVSVLGRPDRFAGLGRPPRSSACRQSPGCFGLATVCPDFCVCLGLLSFVGFPGFRFASFSRSARGLCPGDWRRSDVGWALRPQLRRFYYGLATLPGKPGGIFSHSPFFAAG